MADDKIYEQFSFMGLDEVANPYLLQVGVLNKFDNVDTTFIGGIRKAKGKTRLVQTSLGTKKISGLHIFYHKNSGITYPVVSYNGNIYYFKNNIWNTIKTGLTDTDFYFMSSFNDWLYVFNGIDNPFKWNPVDNKIYQLGINPPTTAPTFNTDVTGNLTANRDYSVKYTYYSSSLGLESSASPASDKKTASSAKGIRWAVTGSSDPQVDKIKFYRTLGNQSAPWYYEGQVNNATGTVYIDTVLADINMTTTTAPTTNDPPPNGKVLCFHMGRFFIAGNSSYPYRIYYSKAAPYHEYFPLDHFLHTPSGENVTGMVSTSASLYIFTPNTISLLDTPMTGDPVASWAIYQVEGSVGCIAPRTLVSTNNLMLFLSRYGVYAFDGRISKKIEGIDLSGVNWDYAHLSCATYHNGRYFISLPVNATYPNTTYELILEDWRWAKHSNKCASVMGVYGSTIVAGDPQNGIVWKFFDSNSNDGSPFTISFLTPPLRLTSYPVYKEFSRLHFLMSGEGKVNVKVIVDKQETTAEMNIAGFDYYQFPQPIWRGRTIQIGLEHTSDKAFTLYGFALQFREAMVK